VRTPLVLVALAVALATGCAPSPLPEEGSADAKLYVERCGGCHPVYRPAVLKAKMWETMVARMEIEMSRRGLVLAPTDRAAILAYLKRNAGES
jgi:hypothetical protein